MLDISPILVVGATGMLGRPVVRRLLEDGFAVRAMVRDETRARSVLPEACELVPGDVRDQDSLAQVMDGTAGVYVNLAAPMKKRPPRFDPERDGAINIAKAARQAGVPHLLRISAMGVEEFADRWWPARHKAEADQAVMESGVPYTIFRPTWFMESLATLIMGPLLLSFRLQGAPLRWLAGDDYARQVGAAITSEAARNRIYHPQGPECVSLKTAITRFRAAYPKRLLRLPVPRVQVRLAGMLSGQANYMHNLLDMTIEHFSRIDREVIPTDLPEAAMIIEDYVQYIARTGDRPKKT